MDDAPLPNQYSISLKSDKNNMYNINFSTIDNYLLIQSIEESKHIIYEDKILLKDVKLNKYFSICESIYDVLYTIKPNLSNNLKLEEINEGLKLIIPLNHPLAKEISFNLKKKQNDNSNDSDLIQELYNIVIDLSLKFENQQKEIDALKKRIRDLETANKSQGLKKEEKISKQQNNMIIFQDINNNNNNFYNNNINPKAYYFCKTEYSYIMRSKIEELSIKNWIHSNSIIHFKLLFRMSRDGTSAINFHTKCDSKGKTLILVETKDGKRIGGYTSLQWNMDGMKKYGDNLWLFTFENNMYRFHLIKPGIQGAIICDMNNGPSFDEGLIFKDNTLSVGYVESNGILKMSGFSGKIIQIKELEVFQVNIKY